MLNPVVNYSPVVNPQNPSFDPFEEYTPPAPGAECRLVLIIESLVGHFVYFCSGPSVYPGSIQDILDSLDGQYPPSDQGLPKPYDPPPELHYPPATHPAHKHRYELLIRNVLSYRNGDDIKWTKDVFRYVLFSNKRCFGTQIIYINIIM